MPALCVLCECNVCARAEESMRLLKNIFAACKYLHARLLLQEILFPQMQNCDLDWGIVVLIGEER